MKSAIASIRLLTVDDASVFVDIRRLSLSMDPSAFSARPDTDAWSKLETARQRFSSATSADGPFVLGAFDSGLVGVIGVIRTAPVAARIWGFYVKPEHRGDGLGRTLVRSAIDVARRMPGVVRIELGVAHSCTAARHVYTQSGFQDARFDATTNGHDMVLELTSPNG
jgi:ribosomal protein S18 acetylase RimI-like enzyme